MKLIFEKSSKGRRGVSLPRLDVEETVDPIPREYLRQDLDMPEVGEVDVIRHYMALSKRNFGVDDGFYPLGSCTMKYNPKINEDMARLPRFAHIHPLAPERLSQGALQLIYELQEDLKEITGLSAVTLQPAAGSHGELTGVMIFKKYFKERGEKRDVLLVPDSAHGTNPASAAMCGFTVKTVATNDTGEVDIDDLKSKLDSSVAGMMLTNPNTLGLFETRIKEIADLLHANGSLLYGDGANLNAIVGVVKVADTGIDILHINLHKTFSTPHGGGGPGSGPIGVVEKLAKYIPLPIVKKKEDTYYCYYGEEESLDAPLPSSIGRVRAFHGNFGVLVRAYTYIKSLGASGIREIAENAVLNANYLMHLLKDEYHLAFDSVCKHEFVLSDKDMPNGVTTSDIAKRLLDYGFYAPTIYFPLVVPGAIMIEPTETESKQTLDEFAEAMIAIKKEAEETPDVVKNAPMNQPVGRLDAVRAARKPLLTYDDVVKDIKTETSSQ